MPFGSNGTILTTASNNWMNRPDDERFASLQAFTDAATERRRACREVARPEQDLTVRADGEDLLLGSRHKEGGLQLSSYGFGAVARRAKAPAAYMRTLPTDLAAQCLDYGIQREARDDHSVVALVQRTAAGYQLRTLTSARYARIWDAEIGTRLQQLQQTPGTNWIFPEAFRRAAGAGDVEHAWGPKDGKPMPTAFTGDRDSFVMLVDYDHPITLPGSDTPLAKGFWVENSEVGARSFRVTRYLFDYVCCNLLVWGAQDVQVDSVRHVGDAREKAFTSLDGLGRWVNESTADDVERIRTLQACIIDDDILEVPRAVYKAVPEVTLGDAKAALEAATASGRYGDPRSAWAMLNGLTEISQAATYAGDRADKDRAAGKLVEVFAG